MVAFITDTLQRKSIVWQIISKSEYNYTINLTTIKRIIPDNKLLNECDGKEKKLKI